MNMKIAAAALVLFLAAFCWLAVPATHRAAADETNALTDSARAALGERAAAVFKKSCATSGCHAGTYPKARLSLEPDKMISAVKDVKSRQIDTLMLVDTKSPSRSYLLMKIRGDAAIRGERMPDGKSPLKTDEIKTIERWAASLAAVRAKPSPPDTVGKP